MRPRRVTTTIAALATTALLAAAGTANAAEPADPVQETAELIADVAPDEGDVVQAPVVNGEMRVDVSIGDVVVPIDPEQPITIEDDGDTGLEVTLPEELDVSAASIADDGTVLYSSPEGDTSAGVQVMEDGGVRLFTVIPDMTATHEFTYAFEGLAPVLREDGGADLVSTASTDDDARTSSASVTMVAPPWAVDSAGVPVPTRYEVRDGALVQTVSPGPDVTYPIVADPTVGRIDCAITAQNPHVSEGARKVGKIYVIYKTIIKCTGTGSVPPSATIRVRGGLFVDPARFASDTAGGVTWTQTRSSIQTKVVTLGKSYTFYTPLDGQTGGTTTGHYMGTSTVEIVTPVGEKVGSDSSNIVFCKPTTLTARCTT